jgi:hypothetical protein
VLGLTEEARQFGEGEFTDGLTEDVVAEEGERFVSFFEATEWVFRGLGDVFEDAEVLDKPGEAWSSARGSRPGSVLECAQAVLGRAALARTRRWPPTPKLN